MFRKRLKIKQIAATTSGDFLFTLGLGNDGNAYIWDSTLCAWRLHKAVPQQEQK